RRWSRSRWAPRAMRRSSTLAFQRIDDLRIARGAQRDRDQRLGLTAGEDRRTMRAGQRTGLDADRTHRLVIAAVDARLTVENALANDAALQIEHLRGNGLGAPLRRTVDLRHRSREGF